MQPYANHEAARHVAPGLVDRTLKAALKQPEVFQNPAEDIVFYHCRYLGADNRCQVYEDRPGFCRDYPDTPFVVFAPGCAYENWGAQCRTAFNQLKQETERLSEIKAQLEKTEPPVQADTPAGTLELSRLWLASPLSSWLR